VSVSEATLDEHLNAALVGRDVAETPLGTARIEHVAAELREERVQISGSARAGFLSLPIVLSGDVDVVDERPVVHVREAHIAGAELSDATRLLFERVLQAEVDAALAQDDIAVDSILLDEQRILITGHRRG
jgi:hypothetical protein